MVAADVFERYEMADARAGRCCWRAMAPGWAFLPLSGEGAAINGGRWNRQWRSALYVSEAYSPEAPPATAWREFEQSVGPRSGTVAPYELRIEKLVDLTKTSTQQALRIDPAVFGCMWRDIVADGLTPPTWTLSDTLVDMGADAIRVPSQAMPGGVNVVIWNIGSGVQVVDPTNSLPVDQASWPSMRSP